MIRKNKNTWEWYAHLKQYSCLLLILSGYFFVSCIYPARRFIFEYAVVLKLFYLSVCAIGCCAFIRNFSGRSLWLVGLLISFGIALLGSVITSHYPVRAGSELDIMLAAAALSYLFWSNQLGAPLVKLRLLCMTILVFLHFSVCLVLACAYTNRFTYPFKELFFNYFFNPTALLQFLPIGLNYVRSPFDYSNYAGCFGALTWPVFLGLLLAEPGKRLRIVWGIGFIYALSIVYASRCRMGWFCSIPIILLWCLYGLWRSYLNRFIKFCIPLLLVGCFCLLAWKTPRTHRLVEKLLQGDLKSFCGPRLALAQDGWKLVQQKPFFGHGITTTPLHYLEAHPDFVVHLWQLHVAPIQFLIEFGWFGGIIFLLFLFSILYYGYRALRQFTLSSRQNYALFGCLMSFAVYLLFNSEDVWENFLLAGFVSFIIGGILTFSHYVDLSKNRFSCDLNIKKSYLFAILKNLVRFIFVLIVYESVRDIGGRYHFNSFIQKVYQKDKSCERDLRRALQWDPHNLFYWNQGGYLYACRGFGHSKDLARQAVNFYESSIQINPYQPEILESLGALYAFLEDWLKSADCYMKAIQCVPHHTFAYIQLLEVLRYQHLQELYDDWLAMATFAMPKAVFSQPDLIKNLKDNPLVQRKCLAYFEQAEAMYAPELKTNSSWRFEKFLRKRFFLNGGGLLEKLSDNVFQNRNWLLALNWNNLLKLSSQAQWAQLHYCCPLNEGSCNRILLHGNIAPWIKISSIKPIAYPMIYDENLDVPRLYWNDGKIVLFTANGYRNGVPKHARELLQPLIKKTKAAFQSN